MPEILPQYDGPLTPRMQFEDLLGDLVQTAARYGRRTGEPYEEVDSWERSPAGKRVALTTYSNGSNPNTTAAELAVFSPSRTLRLMSAVRGNFMNDISLDAIDGIGFLLNEPKEAAVTGLPVVEMRVYTTDDQTFRAPLTYEQFAEICDGAGVYEQERLPLHTRMANWVLAHTMSHGDYDVRDWK